MHINNKIITILIIKRNSDKKKTYRKIKKAYSLHCSHYTFTFAMFSDICTKRCLFLPRAASLFNGCCRM